MIDLKKANFFEKLNYLSDDCKERLDQSKIGDVYKEGFLDSTTMALNILYGYEGLGRPLSIAGAATVAVGGATWVQATGIENVAAAFRKESRQLASPEAYANAYHGTSNDLGPNPWDKLCENPNLGQNIGYGLVIAGTIVFIANKINAALDYAIEEKEKRTQLHDVDEAIQTHATPNTLVQDPMLMERVSPAHAITQIA